MAKETSAKKIGVYIAIAVGLSTILGRGCDVVSNRATQAHTVEDIQSSHEELKSDGCDKSRTNAYNMVRIETQLAGLKEIVEGIKADNDSDHRDILAAVNASN